MAGLGDMKGLGSALPDGGKKRPTPGRTATTTRTTRTCVRPPTDLAETISTRARRRVRDPCRADLFLASPHHKIAPLFPSLTISLPSLFRPQFAKGVDQAEVMKGARPARR